MSIAPTLDLEQAGDHCWDVVVIGAGPAGAMAARQLARLGKSVLLVDKAQFPRWKVCGCCLNARALAGLDAVGLGGLVGRCEAVPLENVELAAAKGQVSLPFSGGVALSREALDAALVQAAIEAGVSFLSGVCAALGNHGQPARSVVLRQETQRREASARLVLVAVGLAGLAARGQESLTAVANEGSRIGAGVVADRAPGFYRDGTVYMACGSGGYLGLVRREDGRLNLAAAFDVGRVREAGGLGPAATTILDEVGWPQIYDLARLGWRGTPALTCRARSVAGERVLVLGDAAGYIEPFTGEGMAWALATGAAVAPLACRAVDSWGPESAKEWATCYASVVRRHQRLCRLAAWALRRPALVRTLVGGLARAPRLATPVLDRLAGK
jgi:flavin-dependent dehydrogenase